MFRRTFYPPPCHHSTPFRGTHFSHSGIFFPRFRAFFPLFLLLLLGALYILYARVLRVICSPILGSLIIPYFRGLLFCSSERSSLRPISRAFVPYWDLFSHTGSHFLSHAGNPLPYWELPIVPSGDHLSHFGGYISFVLCWDYFLCWEAWYSPTPRRFIPMLGSSLLSSSNVPVGLSLTLPLAGPRQGHILSLILGDLIEPSRLLRVATLRVTMSSRAGQIFPCPNAPFAASGYYMTLLD